MGYSLVTIKDDPFLGKILVAEGEERKGGSYIARIRGLSEKYKYEREFLGKKTWADKKKTISRTIVKLNELQKPFDLLEIRSGGSWSIKYQYFYVFDAEKEQLIKISEEELRKKLAEKLGLKKE